jgi:hypothetical protein
MATFYLIARLPDFWKSVIENNLSSFDIFRSIKINYIHGISIDYCQKPNEHKVIQLNMLNTMNCLTCAAKFQIESLHNLHLHQPSTDLSNNLH